MNSHRARREGKGVVVLVVGDAVQRFEGRDTDGLAVMKDFGRRSLRSLSREVSSKPTE